MSPEEYQRLKEAEKAHLRKLKELKEAVRSAQRTRSIGDALDRMTQEPARLIERHDEMVQQLALETAMSEARLDVARDLADEREEARRAEEMEAEMQTLRAQEILRQVRQEMGVAGAGAPRGAASQETPPSEKTIGRTGALEERGDPSSSPEEAPPEKTIGRKRS